MSKVNSIIVNGTEYTVNEEVLNSIVTICNALGTKKTVKTTKAKAQPKAEVKATAKAEVKADKATFDRKAYESISREFGCWSDKRNCCYKKCRDVVYKVMDGSLTKAKGKAEVAKILKSEYGI